jgi:predicted ArsR family transcriptional regulator
MSFSCTDGDDPLFAKTTAVKSDTADDRLIAALAKYPNGTTAPQLAKDLDVEVAVTRNRLSDLKGEGKVQQPGRGLWRLAREDGPDLYHNHNSPRDRNYDEFAAGESETVI